MAMAARHTAASRAIQPLLFSRRFATATSRSLLAAAWRDVEQRKTRPLIREPQLPILLSALASPSEVAAMEAHPLAVEGGVDIIAVRARMLDAWLDKPTWPPLRTTRRQTVLLGAGADTRVYRLGFSRFVHTVFEVDADAALLHKKHAALQAAGFAPRCEVRLIGADASDTSALEAALTSAGFDPSLPTRWLAESALEQLPPPRHQPLFEFFSAMGGTAGSGVAAQVLEPSYSAHVSAVLAAAPAAPPPVPPPFAPLATTVDDALEALRGAGWTEARAMRHGDLQETTGRATHPGFAIVFADADVLTAE